MKEHVRQVVAGVPSGQRTNVMREYLQARVLQAFQSAGAWTSLAFMGGTALRLLYGTPRFSEDLDFTLEDATGGYDLSRLLDGARTAFAREGYAVEVRRSTKTAVEKGFVRFPGLQHELGLSPHVDQVFSVKVEVDTRPPAGAGIETSMVRRHVTLRLPHHDKPSLLAGKTAALLLREWVKGRDVYDLVWYLADPAWPEPNEVLLADACRQAGREDLLTGPDGWKRALFARLRTASWEQVQSDVERFLERHEEMWMVERETVLGVLAQRGWADE
jgi:hypothetical protein